MDPFRLFSEWFAKAKAHEPNDPDAMALATSSFDGRPSVRMVLLKEHGPDGFVFYTNGESRKGQELAGNPHAALCLHWKSLRKQVRIEGTVVPVDDEQADGYFHSRSRESQLAAAASLQSRPLADRDLLMARYRQLEEEYEGEEVPRPPHWTGYRVVPERIEFWEDGDHRLHTRRQFVRTAEGWREGLLYP